MARSSGTSQVYEHAMIKGNFNVMKQYYTAEDSIRLSVPLTKAGDTALHMAVYSKTKQPLQYLLEIAVGDSETEALYKARNEHGSTALHVAAKIGNYEAVKLLAGKYGSLLEIRDNMEETALFKAAASGHMKVVVHLASQQGQIKSNDKKLKEIHRRNKDNAPILHVTIQGGHYGTALKLVELDGSLALEKDTSGISSLQLLANFPSAFKSGNPMNLRKSILYFVLPIFKNDVKRIHSKATDTGTPDSASGDIETGDAPSDPQDHEVSKTSSRYEAFWRFLSQVRPEMGKLWREKRKHKFAFELAKILIQKDYSWDSELPPPNSSNRNLAKEAGERKGEHTSATKTPKTGEPEENREKAQAIAIKSEQDKSNIVIPQETENPLFTATRNGIVEIVKEILRVSPQVVEIYSDERQNILHIAVLHRQREIFNMVKKMKTPLARFVEDIDSHGYTILHCAADTKHYTGASRPGPAYQLQDELKWFHRVKKLLPLQFAMHKKLPDGKTAKMLFDKKHKHKLTEAQKWIEKTSQSCSTVAVLVATVVFAAAYTVPGGLNDTGLPHFLNSPTFLFFTITDVVSLACSLTAVVMFLSILSSPFEMEDFLHSLPRKLTAGFTLLFLSVATTTLAFASTVLLIIRLASRQLTTTLIYTAAFLPVGIFALMQFPLYLAFVESMIRISKVIKKIFPFKQVRRLCFN